MPQGLRSLLRNKKGVTSIEYGLIAALIACGLILSLGTLGNRLGAVLSIVASSLGGGGSDPTTPAAPATNHFGG